MVAAAGAQAQPGDGLQMQVGCQEEGAGCKGILQAVYFLAPGVMCGCRGGEIPGGKKTEFEILKINSQTR